MDGESKYRGSVRPPASAAGVIKPALEPGDNRIEHGRPVNLGGKALTDDWPIRSGAGAFLSGGKIVTITPPAQTDSFDLLARSVIPET